MKDFLTKHNLTEKVFDTYTEYENDIIKAYYTKKESEQHISVYFKDEQRARIHQNAFYQIITKSVFDAEKGFFDGFCVLVSDYRSYISKDEFLKSISKILNEFYTHITPKKDILTA